MHSKERLEEFKSGKKPYNCLKCKEKLYNISQGDEIIKEAETVIEIEDTFSCGLCKYTTEEEMELKQHMTDVHENQKVTCEKCKREFKTSDEMKKHGESECTFKCNICAQVFTTSDMLKSHSNCHINLAEEIVTNVEKHLEERCNKLEETIATERDVNKKNLSTIEELKSLVKKADEITRKVNEIVAEKEKELTLVKDKLTKEICANELKAKEVDTLIHDLKKKDDEIRNIKEQQSTNDDKNHEEDIEKLTQKLEET